MASLNVFPDPPPSGTITLCEKNADLVTSPVGSRMADQVGHLSTYLTQFVLL